MGHFGTQDAFFPIDGIGKLEAKMKDAGVDVTFHRYLAHHAFANETAVGEGRIAGTQYDPAWAQVAWDRTLTFLGRTLWS
jgi:carboxymethylenebutenolidase